MKKTRFVHGYFLLNFKMVIIYNLAIPKFRCFHAGSPAHILRGNSTEPIIFRGITATPQIFKIFISVPM